GRAGRSAVARAPRAPAPPAAAAAPSASSASAPPAASAASAGSTTATTGAAGPTTSASARAAFAAAPTGRPRGYEHADGDRASRCDAATCGCRVGRRRSHAACLRTAVDAEAELGALALAAVPRAQVHDEPRRDTACPQADEALRRTHRASGRRCEVQRDHHPHDVTPRPGATPLAGEHEPEEAERKQRSA